ncbi:MAG: DNA-directed RNA polymerase, partial [bacterium]
VTPRGLQIEQKYVKFTVNKIKGLSVPWKIAINTPTDFICKRKQQNGLMPNIIHSMDASNITCLIDSLTKVCEAPISLLTIHDCFGTHAQDVPLIQQYVKRSFAELYVKKDFIEEFHKRCLTAIRDLETWGLGVTLIEETNIII